MSKNYDNWERLVTAVGRREQDKRLALSHSRDSSISSTLSSPDLGFSPNTQFDHHQSLVLRERDDFLGLETFLPDKQEAVVWMSSSMKFFFDRRTRKNCFLLGAGATNLDMSSEHKPHPNSRYSEVAQLLDSWKQYIRAKIKTNKLSPETLYAAYLVFRFTEKHAEPQAAKSTITISYGEADCYSKKQDQIVKFQGDNRRSDGWFETQLGAFYLDLDTTGEIIVELKDAGERSFNGLTVQGIEFRPLET